LNALLQKPHFDWFAMHQHNVVGLDMLHQRQNALGISVQAESHEVNLQSSNLPVKYAASL
jgi:hypothetical protein